MRQSIANHIWISALILALVIAFHLFLISKTYTIDSLGNMRTASTGYGDIPFHMTQVSKFALQSHIDFNEPIFDGEKLRYAFLINAISGLILRFWGNWYVAMQLPVMGFMTAATVLTFLLYRKFLKSNWGAVVAVVIFLLGAGFGANWHFRNYLASSTSYNGGFIQYLVDNTASTIIRWDAVYPEQNITWGAPLSLVFLHQRAFFLGFFMFSLFCYLFQKWQSKPNSKTLTIFLAMIVGLGPLGHYHSYIAMCTVIAFVGLFTILRRNFFFFRRLMILGLIIMLLSIPQIIYLVQGKESVIFGHDSFIKFRFGWMTEPTIGSIKFNPDGGLVSGIIFPFFNFLWLNFGVILPIFVIAGFSALWSFNFRRKFEQVLFLFAVGICLFVLVQLFRFQPWDFDNNKILVYYQFFAAPVFVAFFLWILEHRKVLGLFLFAIFTILAIYSGIIDEIPRFMVPFDRLPVIFGTDAIATAEYIKDNISQDERIITTSTHLNPVSSLAGRPVLVGYPGWLWTKGINYAAREQSLREFYTNPLSISDNSYIRNAEYVLLDPTAIYDWKTTKEKFDTQFTRIFSNTSYSLYKMR